MNNEWMKNEYYTFIVSYNKAIMPNIINFSPTYYMLYHQNIPKIYKIYVFLPKLISYSPIYAWF